ncbi:MAG: PEP/pyruvate-binding domain-containing protein [bacterium]
MIKVITDVEVPKRSSLGGKAFSLCTLSKEGINIPKGFIVTCEAFFRYLEYNCIRDKIEKLSSEINRENLQEKVKAIYTLTQNKEMPPEISQEIHDHLKLLNNKAVAIRSSAVSEDSAKSSFAGMHDTFLNIKPDLSSIIKNIKRCMLSLFSERAVTYRLIKKLGLIEGIAVIVQEMIPAQAAGITFTVHPMIKECMLIEASYGIGELIVSGKIEPDAYTIKRGSFKILNKTVGLKDKMCIVDNSGCKTIAVKKDMIDKDALKANEIEKISKECFKIENIFKGPQDIEWCILNNRIWILQSRIIKEVMKYGV